MDPGPRATITEAIATMHATGAVSGDALSALCADALGVSGVGIMLMTNGEHRGMLGSTGTGARIVEELQFTLGEGPCIDACIHDRPVLEPNLGDPGGRWPAFAGPALDAGVRSVFGFPLHAGRTCIGALDVCEPTAGPLTDRQVADAVYVAQLVSDAVLLTQIGGAQGAVPDLLEAAVDYRAVVHQATGMVAAQLAITATDALARIRAHAFAESRAINDVAEDIVRRSIRLD